MLPKLSLQDLNTKNSDPGATFNVQSSFFNVTLQVRSKRSGRKVKIIKKMHLRRRR